MKLRVPVLLLSLVSVGCATKPPQSVLQKIDKVAVFATFDDRLSVIQASTSTKESIATIADWKINDVITDDVVAVMQQQGKQAFPLKVDEARIAAGKEEAIKLRNIYLGNSYQLLEQYITGEAEAQGARYLFVMHPMSNEQFPLYRAGFGFFCQSTKGMKGDLQGYGMMRVLVWDLKAKEMLARETLTPAQVSFQTGKSCAEIARMTPAKMAETHRDQVVALVKKSTAVGLALLSTPPETEKK